MKDLKNKNIHVNVNEDTSDDTDDPNGKWFVSIEIEAYSKEFDTETEAKRVADIYSQTIEAAFESEAKPGTFEMKNKDVTEPVYFLDVNFSTDMGDGFLGVVRHKGARLVTVYKDKFRAVNIDVEITDHLIKYIQAVQTEGQKLILKRPETISPLSPGFEAAEATNKLTGFIAAGALKDFSKNIGDTRLSNREKALTELSWTPRTIREDIDRSLNLMTIIRHLIDYDLEDWQNVILLPDYSSKWHRNNDHLFLIRSGKRNKDFQVARNTDRGSLYESTLQGLYLIMVYDPSEANITRNYILALPVDNELQFE